MKKIIFLDGDGTLWYPKETKRARKPHWIYDDPVTKDNYLEHLELAPKVKYALEKFKEMGIVLVLISANPKSEEVAIKEIMNRLNYLDLAKYFNIVRSSAGDDPSGKGKVILEILEKLNLQKSDALMVGDSIIYDYLAATNVGVESFWIENPVSKLPETLPVNFRKIFEVSDVVGQIIL